jgi:hypothetical protein
VVIQYPQRVFLPDSDAPEIVLPGREGVQMDFDREYELESAGIDAFDYSLMADDERADVLRDARLDPDDFDGVEFESSFDAWLALQAHGLNLWELELMDEAEKKAYQNPGY